MPTIHLSSSRVHAGTGCRTVDNAAKVAGRWRDGCDENAQAWRLSGRDSQERGAGQGIYWYAPLLAGVAPQSFSCTPASGVYHALPSAAISASALSGPHVPPL
jgi:hypothetical protein